MHIHKRAPEFTLPDQNGKNHSLATYKGKWVVLYFYPKDDTPGCTTEACTFRDAFEDLQKHDVIVLGVSKDSVESHKKFAEKHNLNFPLLADTDAEVSKLYGAWHPHQFLGLPGIKRETFLIDPDGDVAKHYEKVDPIAHAKEILEDVQELDSEL
jgi:thioredoxin-dependent peroxiredoxin